MHRPGEMDCAASRLTIIFTTLGSAIGKIQAEQSYTHESNNAPSGRGRLRRLKIHNYSTYRDIAISDTRTERVALRCFRYIALPQD